MRAPRRDPVVTKQVVVWATWRPDPKLVTGGHFDPIDVAEGEPYRIWTLFDELNQQERPTLPITPVHRLNAFAEDRVHDWTWQVAGLQLHAMLKYYTRVMDQSCWLLLEYVK